MSGSKKKDSPTALASQELWFRNLETSSSKLTALMKEIDSGVEVTDAIAAAFKDVHLELKANVDTRCHILDSLELYESRAKSHKDYYAAIEKRCKRVRDEIKRQTVRAIEESELDKFVGAEFELRAQASPGKLLTEFHTSTKSIPHVVYSDIILPDEVKANYLKKVELTVLDVEKVKKDLKSGKNIRGCRWVKEKHLRHKPIVSVIE